MRAAAAWLALVCGCSTVGSSAVRTASVVPGGREPVVVQFTQKPADADELGIVEAQGRGPAAKLQQVLAELTGRVAALGGNLARVDAFATRYDVVNESYTYDCGTTGTRLEPRSVTRPGPNRSMATITEVVPVSYHQPKTCNGVRKIETPTLTFRGRAFRARDHMPAGAARRPAWSGDVDILMEGEPVPGRYDEIAIVTAAGAAEQATLRAVTGALQDEARRVGCNAVIKVRYDRGTQSAAATGVAVWID